MTQGKTVLVQPPREWQTTVASALGSVTPAPVVMQEHPNSGEDFDPFGYSVHGVQLSTAGMRELAEWLNTMADTLESGAQPK